MLEVQSVANLLGTPVSYAYAVKAGPWVFLNGHEAFDFEGGIPKGGFGSLGLPALRAAALPPRGRFHPATDAADLA